MPVVWDIRVGRLSSDRVTALMLDISNTELEEIQSYFLSVSEQLNIVEEWGENMIRGRFRDIYG